MNALVVGLLGIAAAAGPARAQVTGQDRAKADTSFAALQERGKTAMGVDQYTSTHKFDALPDGGRIELQRDGDDSAGVAQIRKHLREIAAAFQSGDFSTPAFVHMREVPGTSVMAAKRSQITYTFSPLPRGGEVRIRTKDPEALKAIQAFMAFQRHDHHAGGMDHDAMNHEPTPQQGMAPGDERNPQPTARGMMMAGARMNGGPMGMRMQGDSAFATDMSVVHEMLLNHNNIRRTVTALPNGIRTVTESDNPQVARYIIEHVASMEQRLKDSSVFNVASQTLPTIFQNKERIQTEIQQAANGVTLTQTSDDSATVAALQAHASEVSELAQEGMVAMMRSVMANGGPMGMGRAMGMMGGMGGGMMNGGCPMMGKMMRPMMQRGDSGRGGNSPMPQSHRPQRRRRSVRVGYSVNR